MANATEQSEAGTWGVTKTQVLALAAHVDTNATYQADNVYSPAAGVTRSIKDSDIIQWIKDVAASVDVRLNRRTRLGEEARTRLETAAQSVIAVGAAAYVVDAHYPARASTNSQVSYGEVLWTRYREGLDGLVSTLEELLAEADTEDTGSSLSAAGGFPPPAFPDDFHTRY
ncbi:hypothetical protein [Nesterenkonia rhizosphaerae]|uniref:Uncharacterized protein n=1 Tax=Nesterenkonia rhizosphaerae TaxID=1348272 RepID=A0ABP9FWE5_9MICC